MMYEVVMVTDNQQVTISPTQSLLQSHEKVEAEIGTYSSEIVRHKELSKKVIEGACVAPAFVSVCECVLLSKDIHPHVQDKQRLVGSQVNPLT